MCNSPITISRIARSFLEPIGMRLNRQESSLQERTVDVKANMEEALGS